MFGLKCVFKKNNLFDSTNAESFSFGTAYSMCVGDCARFYSISNGQLFADNVANYFTGPISYSNTPLPDAKYILAKQLLDEFPVYLINNPDTTFGCPDCAHQGGIHIQLKQNGMLKKLHINIDFTKQPNEIKTYIAKLLTVLGQL